MSDLPIAPGAAGPAVALLLLLSFAGGCGRPSRGVEAASVIRGKVGNIIAVDSEHGELNGVFGPRIIYDLYLEAPGASPDAYVLWVTRETLVYEAQGDEFKQVSFNVLKGGEEVEAHVGELDRSGYRPGAYAVKIVILK